MRTSLKIVESSVQLKDGHYKIELPFKTPHVNIPNNLSVAKQRVSTLQRRLLKDETFHKEYSDFLTDVINKGYAEQVPEGQLERSDGKIWYPHLPWRIPSTERKSASRV